MVSFKPSVLREIDAAADTSDCIIGQLRLIRMLRGLTPDFTSVNDVAFDEARFERRLEDPQLANPASYYWIRRLQASVDLVRSLGGGWSEPTAMRADAGTHADSIPAHGRPG